MANPESSGEEVDLFATTNRALILTEELDERLGRFNSDSDVSRLDTTRGLTTTTTTLGVITTHERASTSAAMHESTITTTAVPKSTTKTFTEGSEDATYKNTTPRKTTNSIDITTIYENTSHNTVGFQTKAQKSTTGIVVDMSETNGNTSSSSTTVSTSIANIDKVTTVQSKQESASRDVTSISTSSDSVTERISSIQATATINNRIQNTRSSLSTRMLESSSKLQQTTESSIIHITGLTTVASTTFVPLISNSDDDNTVLIVGISCAIVGLILGIILTSLGMLYLHKHRTKLHRKPTVAERNPQEKTFERLDFSLSRPSPDTETGNETRSSYKRYDEPFPMSDCGSEDIQISGLNVNCHKPIRTSSAYHKRSSASTYGYKPRARALSDNYASSQDDTVDRNFRRNKNNRRPSSCDTYKTDLPEDNSTVCEMVFRNETLPEENLYSLNSSPEHSNNSPNRNSRKYSPMKPMENDPETGANQGHINDTFLMGKDILPPPSTFQNENEKQYDNEDVESHSGNSSVSYFDIQISPSAFQNPYRVSAVASGIDSPTYQSDTELTNVMNL